MRATLALSLVFSFSTLVNVNGQDGGPPAANTPGNYTYNCDPTQCKLPTCHCASTSPPGGLTPAQTPMFILFTADDAVQPYTINAVNQFLEQRKNPNGCPVKMTYFVSLAYTNYINVTEWYELGNEIADHTMTHVEWPDSEEINGNLIALNALAGIPFSGIQGFRTPYLNFSAQTMELLKEAQFLYDSSATSSIPVTFPNTDAYFPYTLDNGLANSCGNEGIQGTVCNGKPVVPGVWEVPMYSIFDERGTNGIHLMDPWLDIGPLGGTAPNDTETLSWMKNTFTAHYTGNRQPFGLYTHPIHIAPNVPGVITPNSTINMINEFLDWAQVQQDVWIITNYQLVQWMQNPTAIADLNNFAPFKCQVPQVTGAVCNGIPANEAGLVQHCDFPDFPFGTCYGCPQEAPTPDDPNPPQATPSTGGLRYRLPANCSTPFWDPIAGKCLCTSSSCQFTDMSRTIGPNNSTLTGGGQGAAVASTPSYVPFNGNDAKPSLSIDPAVWFTCFAVVAGLALGAGALL